MFAQIGRLESRKGIFMTTESKRLPWAAEMDNKLNAMLKNPSEYFRKAQQDNEANVKREYASRMGMQRTR